MYKLIVFMCVTVASTAAVLQCYTGGSINGVFEGYASLPCYTSDFCYKQTSGDYVTKGCGYGFCTQTGCNGGLCCCKGDLCNGAQMTSSLLMTSIAVAVVAFFRY